MIVVCQVALILDPFWGPFWDHFGTILGKQMRSKKCFKKRCPSNANYELLTWREPPRDPPLICAEQFSNSNSFRKVDNLQLKKTTLKQMLLAESDFLFELLLFESTLLLIVAFLNSCSCYCCLLLFLFIVYCCFTRI